MKIDDLVIMVIYYSLGAWGSYLVGIEYTLFIMLFVTIMYFFSDDWKEERRHTR